MINCFKVENWSSRPLPYYCCDNKAALWTREIVKIKWFWKEVWLYIYLGSPQLTSSPLGCGPAPPLQYTDWLVVFVVSTVFTHRKEEEVSSQLRSFPHNWTVYFIKLSSKMWRSLAGIVWVFLKWCRNIWQEISASPTLKPLNSWWPSSDRQALRPSYPCHPPQTWSPLIENPGLRETCYLLAWLETDWSVLTLGWDWLTDFSPSASRPAANQHNSGPLNTWPEHCNGNYWLWLE